MLGTRLHISPYQRQDRSQLLDLAWYSQWTHKHLDWYKLSQWVDQELGVTLLAWQGEELVGYIGLSEPINGASWIRTLGIRNGRTPELIVRQLWESAQETCLERGIASVVILMVTNWLPTFMSRLGFRYVDDVITLSHFGGRLPSPPTSEAVIRPADASDIERIVEIDRLAFKTPWQLSKQDIWQAIRISAYATVAMVEDEVVAFQLSTRQDEVGHLARLAVDPAHQRRRIASLLLHQLLEDFRSTPVETVSVNTQLSNISSQRLYQQFGFFRNGYDIELWRKQIR